MKKSIMTAGVLAIAATGIAMGADLTPSILLPDFEGARVISGLSNNGKYGVASVSPEESGFSYNIGAVFYDLTGSKPVATDLKQKYSAAAANDVTDDGKIVVGTVDLQPAYCRNENGTWTWHILPVPQKTFTIMMDDFSGGPSKPQTVTLNGGDVRAVTPDGRYAVGVTRCNEWELLEQAVMWDLTTGQVVEVDSPVTGSDGEDYYQTRYNQISDDGRYLLCWNAFSYSGSIIFVYDRQTGESIYIEAERNADGSFTPRLEGYYGIDMDGVSKSLTSDGRYVGAGIESAEGMFPFAFDVKNKKLTVYNDGIHTDVTGWSVTKDGMPLGGTPSSTPYADAMAAYDNYLFPFSALYEGVYGMDMEGKYGIDNTGKPTLVSDDSRTIVFVTSKTETYVLKLKEDLKDALSRVNLMSTWTASPVEGTAMAAFTKASIAFENPIEADASKYASITLKDSKGNLIGNPLASGGVQADGNKLVVTFRGRELTAGETYTLSVPAGVCWVKGRPGDVNPAIEVSYKGRANTPVTVADITPKSGSSMASLDLSDNPIQVTFDVPVEMNPAASERPIAHIYVDGGQDSYASLTLDVDLNTNTLIIYPATTVFLYKGAQYEIKVPAGVVADLSGQGPNAAFSISYTGSYVPQLGDEQYLFKSTCDDFGNFLFYEGDYGTPTAEYTAMGFTADTTPWWVVMDEGVEDMAFASHSCYTDGRQADDWVVTRQLRIPATEAAYLTFQGQSYRKGKEDRLKVYVYENNNSLNQLTEATIADIRKNGHLVLNEVLSPGNSEAVLAGEWTDYTVDLSPYAGKNIYICFVNDNKNQSMVMIDNVYVMKEVKAFITMTGATNVVKQDAYDVQGILTVMSDLASYGKISMNLVDGSGKTLSTIEETFSKPLGAGDIYRFSFSDKLPLTLGVENAYTIEYSLDDDKMSYEGIVRNLAFQTTKRVVIEEQTGKDCQWCPLGILAMERLIDTYDDRIVPVILHTYGGTDNKGANMTEYANVVFGGSNAAPIGRINRHLELYSPMYSDANQKYHYTAADIPGSDPVWQDVVAEEMTEPALVDLDLQACAADKAGYVAYEAKVKSAVTVSDQNVRVLGVLLEDHLLDRQTSALHTFQDDALGDFGKGGSLGNNSFLYYFNNVARGYWGQSSNGTGRLLPTTLENGKEYTVDIEYAIPAIVENPEKIKMAVILIDENTGLVINAAMADADVSEVEDIIADEAVADIHIAKAGNVISVSAAGEVEAAVYSLDGRVLKSAHGNGTVTLVVDGYKGIAIVRAASAGKVESRKIMF